MELILNWVRRGDRDFRNIAYGYFLAIEKDLDPVDRMYFRNVHNAQIDGVSA